MDVKEAVARAKDYVGDLYVQEQVSDLGLEEVEFDEHSGEWRVTVGFARPWEKQSNNLFTSTLRTTPLQRSYKVVSISDKTGEIKSLKNLARSA